MSLRSTIHNLKFNKWNLAFIEEPLCEIVEKGEFKLHWMKGNNRRQWFADPFILEVTDTKIICLVEELSYSTMKGRIARLEIERHSYRLINTKILLDLPTHLSFPYIYRRGSDVFVLPENSASGSSTIYKYDIDDDVLIPLHIIAERPFTDATIFREGVNSFLLSTELPSPNGQQLNIFEFRDDTFKVMQKPLQSIVFDNRCARNAGEMFRCGDKLYRPAQDCNGGYGKGVILQEVHLDQSGFHFHNVRSLYPDSWVYNMGYHTFNHYKGLTVIDAHGYRYLLLGRFLETLSSIVRRFLK